MNEKVVQTLRTLIDFFSHQKITYHVTGGLAGSIYGSKWPLSDIDIEVHLADLFRIEKEFSAFVIRHTARYIDSEFDIWLLQLDLCGVPVDINAVEDFYIFRDQEKIRIHTSFQNSKLIRCDDIELRIQNLNEIIEYKRLLNRNADVEDLLGLIK